MKTPIQRPTIGTHALDAPMPPPKAGKTPSSPLPVFPRRIRATFRLTEQAFSAVRGCAVALSRPPEWLTLAGFAEDAFRTKLEMLEKAVNKGIPSRGWAGNSEANARLGVSRHAGGVVVEATHILFRATT